jgi:hypothetical protein
MKKYKKVEFMKKLYTIFIIFILVACDNDDDNYYYVQQTCINKAKSDFDTCNRAWKMSYDVGVDCLQQYNVRKNNCLQVYPNPKEKRKR